MNYNFWGFWLLFAVVYALYWRLGHRGQNRLLLVASYFFYGFWDYRFLFLILLSTVIDFIGGLGVAGVRLPAARLRRLAGLLVVSSVLLCTDVRYPELARALVHGEWQQALLQLPHTAKAWAVPLATVAAVLLYGLALPRLYGLPDAARRKTFLAVSMVANLAILGFFKYCDFFITGMQQALHAVGMSASLSTLGILLPAGISFYTFQAMSYTIDIYRGQAEPTEDFGDFALFVAFFPHLVAGPIMRAHTLLPQIVRPRHLAPGAPGEGLVLVLLGLFKKLVIADNVAPIANAVFYQFSSGHAAGLSGADVLVGVYAFALQIYGDFSGYSSIARGIAKWLGFELVVNFDRPYLAISPSDFWRRWHISLSTWLRDYLYIPLGGSRGGRLATYRNLMITMLLGGLWHGANWTFVAWGLYHGLLLCVFRALGVRDFAPGRAPLPRAWWLVRLLVMFHLTCYGWLLFRADSFATIAAMTGTLVRDFVPAHWPVAALVLLAFYGLPLLLLSRLFSGELRVARVERWSVALRGAMLSYLAVMLIFFQAEQAHEFIYFQF